jgi:hypothetical protein
MAKIDPKRTSEGKVRGFGLGTAILTVQQLKDVHTRLNQAFKRLNDPTITHLLDALATRLKYAGIDVDNQVPLRAFANRSIIDSITESDSDHPNRQSLVNQDELKKVEQAILARKPVKIKVPDRANRGSDKEIIIWPLQILFHNIAWYLAYESMEIDRLLTVTRLDRIQLINSSLPQQRRLEDMQDSQRRLEQLCRRTGGIFLGADHHAQKALAEDKLSDARIKQLLDKGTLVRVGFRCSSRIYAFIRSGTKRYPAEQMRLSGPLSSDAWTLDDKGIQLLLPDPENTTHPYPVELLLPAWTVASDIDFRRWLFGFGGDLKIELPEALREEHCQHGQRIASLYQTPTERTDDDRAAETS